MKRGRQLRRPLAFNTRDTVCRRHLELCNGADSALRYNNPGSSGAVRNLGDRSIHLRMAHNRSHMGRKRGEVLLNNSTRYTRTRPFGLQMEIELKRRAYTRLGHH